VVLASNMRILIKICLSIGFVFIFSCEEQGLSVKCSDCTADEPIQTDLEVKLGQEFRGNKIEVNVYEGNLEDSVLYKSLSVTGTSTTVPVTVNKKYTVTASYYFFNDYYVAVDSAEPRVKYDKTTCNNPCYFVYDKVIDLRLKYSK
jgi:hypothetical protein